MRESLDAYVPNTLIGSCVAILKGSARISKEVKRRIRLWLLLFYFATRSTARQHASVPKSVPAIIE